MGGGTPLRLTPMPVSIAVYLYRITPDGSHVVYRAKQDQADVNELYSVPIAGPASATVKLNSPLVAGGEVLGFEISPDSQRVVYSADQAIDNIDELYSVPLSRRPARHQAECRPRRRRQRRRPAKISSDSRYVVYYADQDTDNVYELYSVPIGGRPVQPSS